LILAQLQHRTTATDSLQQLFAQVLKVAFRKASNRVIGREGVAILVSAIQQEGGAEFAAELCNALLNLCFNTSNVAILVELQSVHVLMSFLRSPHARLRAAALGTLQSICYVAVGRKAVRSVQLEGSISAIGFLAMQMSCKEVLAQARAVGVIHNLSADVLAVAALREAGVIPLLLAALRAPSAKICAAAAGALQNMAREHASGLLIRERSLFLVDLLMCSDIECQVRLELVRYEAIGSISLIRCRQTPLVH
jgi:hypothetical protein